MASKSDQGEKNQVDLDAAEAELQLLRGCLETFTDDSDGLKQIEAEFQACEVSLEECRGLDQHLRLEYQNAAEEISNEVMAFLDVIDDALINLGVVPSKDLPNANAAGALCSIENSDASAGSREDIFSEESVDESDESSLVPSLKGTSSPLLVWHGKSSGNKSRNHRMVTSVTDFALDCIAQGAARQEFETEIQSCRARFEQIDKELNIHMANHRIELTRIIRSNRTRNKAKVSDAESLAQRLNLGDEFDESWVNKCKDITRKWIEAEQGLHDANGELRQ
jgi:hypothetical protein